MNLRDKMLTTEPGLFAEAISDLLYYRSNEVSGFAVTGCAKRIGSSWHSILCKMRAHFEKAAIAELEAEARELAWVAELEAKKAEEAKAEPEENKRLY